MVSSKILRIRNNSAIVIISQVFSLIINIISISLAARYLGVEKFGSFNYLLAIVGIGAKMLDFGFNPIIFRELSKEKKYDKYLGSVLIFRILIILFIVILFDILGLVLGLTILEIILISLLSLNVIFSNKFTNIRELLTIPFKIELKMYIPMLFVILDNILLLVFILFMPYLNGGILYFVIVYFISNIPGAIFLFYNLVKMYKFKIYFRLEEIVYLFKESFPLIGFIIFAFLYVQMDVLFLKNLSGTSSVGIYSTALRLIVPLKLFPNVLVITLFPLIVENVNKSNYNQQIVKFVSKLFFLFSIPFVVFMLKGAEDIVMLVFGEKYLEASIPLKILSIGLFFDFFSFFILDLFTAYNKQKYNFQFIILVTLVVFLADIILIPTLGYIGASLARIISGLFGFFFLLLILKKEIKINFNFLNVRLLLSVIIFLISVYVIKDFSLLIIILISIVIFLFSIFTLKIFSKNEMKVFLQIVNNQKIKLFFEKYYDLT